MSGTLQDNKNNVSIYGNSDLIVTALAKTLEMGQVNVINLNSKYRSDIKLKGLFNYYPIYYKEPGRRMIWCCNDNGTLNVLIKFLILDIIRNKSIGWDDYNLVLCKKKDGLLNTICNLFSDYAGSESENKIVFYLSDFNLSDILNNDIAKYEKIVLSNLYIGDLYFKHFKGLFHNLRNNNYWNDEIADNHSEISIRLLTEIKKDAEDLLSENVYKNYNELIKKGIKLIIEACSMSVDFIQNDGDSDIVLTLWDDIYSEFFV